MLITDKKLYSWQELIDKYPDKWVVVDGAELTDSGFIQSGVLIAVCNDEEIDDFIVSCYEEGKDVHYERTTEESGVGIYTFLVSNGTHLGVAERISSFASEAPDMQG